MTAALPSIRQTNALIFIGSLSLIAVALYMEHGLGMEPCPLCMTQRIFFIATGLVALLAFIANPAQTGRRILAVLTGLLAVLGGSFSGRQLWLQSLPADQVPACGPSLDYIMDTFPLMEALQVMLRGNGNCAEVVWQFLGLSIPGWALVCFSGITVLAIWQCLRPAK